MYNIINIFEKYPIYNLIKLNFVNTIKDNMRLKKGIVFCTLVCLALLDTSCSTYKRIPYFTDVSDSANIAVRTVEFSEPVIQYDDILSITVNTLDAGGASLLSMPTTSLPSGGSGMGGGSLGSLSSLTGGGGGALALPSNATYRVDKSGAIDVPLIGKLIVSGITTAKLKELVLSKVSEYYKNPTVDVRFANFRITVLGEVMRPSTFTFSNEKVTIFDALGQAGDLSIFGKRENVLLIRDSAETKRMVRLNLNSKDLISSPYFFLKQNDILYVEPTKAKIAALDATQTRNYAILSAVISLLIIIATRVQ